MSGEQNFDDDPQIKFLIEGVKKEFGKMMRKKLESFKDEVHDRLDRIEQSRRRQSQHVLPPIRCPRKSLMKEEKSYMDNYEDDYRQFYGSTRRRGGVRDHDDINVENIEVSNPSSQWKNDPTSYLGGKSSRWKEEDNPCEELKKILREFFEAPSGPLTLFDDADLSVNHKEMEIKVEDGEVVTDGEDTDPEMPALEGPDEDEGVPEMQHLENSCEDVLEVPPITLDAKEALTQIISVEEEQRENALHVSCHVEDKVIKQVNVPFQIEKFEDEELCEVVPRQATHTWLEQPWLFKFKKKKVTLVLCTPKQVEVVLPSELKWAEKWAVKEDKPILMYEESQPKRNHDAVQNSFVVRREDFIFDPGIWSDALDLRTNPLQEEGNDAARRSWISVHGPRIKDDMG